MDIDVKCECACEIYFVAIKGVFGFRILEDFTWESFKVVSQYFDIFINK